MRPGQKLHLVRHGEVANPAGVVYGTLPGFGLSDRGRAQVDAAATHLASVVRGRRVLLSSPLDRARETANTIARALGVADGPTFDDRLVEAGSTFDGLPRRFAPISYLARWLDTEARKKREAPSAVAERMLRAVRAALAHEVDEVIIVSHQFPIRMATVALSRAIDHPSASPIARRAPWIYVKGRCALASVTTVEPAPGRRFTTTYWEP